MTNLNEFIVNAVNAGINEKDIEILKTYDTFEEAAKDNDAPFWCYWYAKNVIKGRWEEGENIILLSPFFTLIYCKHIIHGRWEEGENIICTKPNLSYYYALKIIKGRFIKGEPVILTSLYWTCFYAIDVIKGRWIDVESVFLKDTWLNGQYIIYDVCDDRCYKKKYCEHFNIT